MVDDGEIEEVQIFHDAIREHIISLLLFILLYVSSYGLILKFKKKLDSDECTGEDDAFAYRIALWMCTFTLSVSAGSVLLLPISIISNEVLLHNPNSYYVKWLNSSLIHGLWNQVFFFSNVALFILMPFAYFFTESEGFSGSKKGILARVYETAVILTILAAIVFGLSWVALAFFDDDRQSKQTLFDLWYTYLPFLYSCVSFLGVLVLLLCTPLGFGRMFTVMGQLVVKPKFLRDMEMEYQVMDLSEQNMLRKLKHISYSNGSTSGISGIPSDPDYVQEKLEELQQDKKELEKRMRVSRFRRNLGYPLVMLILLGLTVFGVLMVTQNMFQLLVGIKALPVGAKETVLGITSLSALGSIGAGLEIVLILYLMSASVVGFYSLPFFCQIRPKEHDTSMLKIIGNCVVLLILSSALPVLSRTLGITNFDLIGDFGSMDWLGNFYIIFTYNVIFTVATGLCLVNKVTDTVRREIFSRLSSVFSYGRPRASSLNGDLLHD
ncbi:hypothetical protein CHS0354_003851 [Potamilus streckersoni]|uniref:Protein LMBR1L n=1 Tax=Potamilus streckersoni TaxID=2493646 RepID=A0AAE0SGZ8_9BIVA|nr:hypothetical protein CHS0354_003851 [Potamilus streckersoni]